MIVLNYKGEEQQITVKEIFFMIFTKMREIGEAFVGITVKSVVVSVLTYFNDLQRHITRDGVIYGLNVLRIINELSVAHIANDLEEKTLSVGGKNVIIFDLSSDSFDVSRLTMKEETDLIETRIANVSRFQTEDKTTLDDLVPSSMKGIKWCHCFVFLGVFSDDYNF
ncbi:hypothetical protein AgCh_001724 [Apium graveolens]